MIAQKRMEGTIMASWKTFGPSARPLMGTGNTVGHRRSLAVGVVLTALILWPAAALGDAGWFSEYTIPTASSHPFRITSGPDGALWFTEQNKNQIGRVTTSGAVSEFSTIPTAGQLPSGIVAGSDGNLSFTE